jgi:hypothetical protein
VSIDQSFHCLKCILYHEDILPSQCIAEAIPPAPKLSRTIFSLMDVQLRYLHPRCRLLTLFQGPGPGSSNVGFQLISEKLHDARDADVDFSLDHHGFKFMRDPTPFHYEALCNPEIWSEYGLRVEEFLKNETQADYVHVFDTRVRKFKSYESGSLPISRCGHD